MRLITGLGSVLACIVENGYEEPKYQDVTIEILPPEIIGIVAAYSAGAGLLNLSVTASRYRAICLPRIMEVRAALLVSLLNFVLLTI